MNTATIILLFFLATDLILYIVKDGEPHPDYNAFNAFFETVIMLALYHFAGLF